MPKKKDLAPKEDKLVPDETRAKTSLDEAFTKMSEQLNAAVASFQFQNVRDVDMAAHTARGLYASMKQHASQDELLLMKILKDLICLFTPLTRAIVFQLEGHFLKTRDELAKGLATVNDAMATVDQYAQLPDAEKEIIQIYKSLFSVFPIIFKGSDACTRAEIFGYKGNIPQYINLLGEAVAEFRQADQLPSNLNPIFLTLVGFCTSIADRLETRVEVFSSEQAQHYLTTTGDKIFIIHGHDEAKWRELHDLLEEQLKLKTIVLKEEPGAGATLINKFEEFAYDCCYAFVLVTPDDFIKKEGKSYFQARPNVLFELGWFYGHFGRDHVCIVKKGETEMPSDLKGILSIDFHENISEVFLQIQNELKRVGVIKPIDKK